MQPLSSTCVAFGFNDAGTLAWLPLRMPRPTSIHAGKQPQRLHFIVEWAERRHLTQADISRELEVDKSSVSRWFAGTLPAEKHLLALAALLRIDVPGLFRHPDDDWLARFLRGRDEAERARIRATLEAAFPPRAA